MMNIQLVPEGEGTSGAARAARQTGAARETGATGAKNFVEKTFAPAGTENGVGIASISAASARDIRVK